jgi:hypothetical protein
MRAAALTLSPFRIKTILLDFTALLLIYFTPAISHLLNLPLYLFEPMRIMLILSLAHSDRKNTYLLALTLPLFSLLISAHPTVIKSLLITAELSLNVFLFFYFTGRIKNIFSAAAVSIVLSKTAYYAAKFIFISAGLIQSELISTPFIYQVLMTLILSGYLFFIERNDNILH